MAGRKLKMRELRQIARRKNIDSDQSYEELREELDIKKCRFCDKEFVIGWSDKFCSDGCEVEYINEYHR